MSLHPENPATCTCAGTGPALGKIEVLQTRGLVALSLLLSDCLIVQMQDLLPYPKHQCSKIDVILLVPVTRQTRTKVHSPNLTILIKKLLDSGASMSLRMTTQVQIKEAVVRKAGCTRFDDLAMAGFCPKIAT